MIRGKVTDLMSSADGLDGPQAPQAGKDRVKNLSGSFPSYDWPDRLSALRERAAVMSWGTGVSVYVFDWICIAIA